MTYSQSLILVNDNVCMNIYLLFIKGEKNYV